MTTNNSSISLIRLKAVQSRTGLARSTVYKMISTGDFPAQIKISAKLSVWASTAIDDWIDRHIAGSNTVH